jgi:hypothetical protein
MSFKYFLFYNIQFTISVFEFSFIVRFIEIGDSIWGEYFLASFLKFIFSALQIHSNVNVETVNEQNFPAFEYFDLSLELPMTVG